MRATRSRLAPFTHRDLMLLATAPAPFSGPGWIFELKFDGYRVLGVKSGDGARLLSRAGRDLGLRFPEVITTLKTFPDCAIDGELVVLDEKGMPHHDRLEQRSLVVKADAVRRASRRHPAVMFAFDLLSLDGRDCRRLPLVQRKSRLRSLLKANDRIAYTDHVEENGQALYAEAAKMGLEGIVAKKADAPYSAGRSGAWLKIKTPIGRDVDRERMKDLGEWKPKDGVRQ
jgi:bifunctional non-homologous end joining protein LigD